MSALYQTKSSSKRTMSVRRVQEVELSPFQWSPRLRARIERLRLHSPDISGEDDISFRMLAALARLNSRAQAADNEG